jgi:hypothetical protein
MLLLGRGLCWCALIGCYGGHRDAREVRLFDGVALAPSVVSVAAWKIVVCSCLKGWREELECVLLWTSAHIQTAEFCTLHQMASTTLV